MNASSHTGAASEMDTSSNTHTLACGAGGSGKTVTTRPSWDKMGIGPDGPVVR